MGVGAGGAIHRLGEDGNKGRSLTSPSKLMVGRCICL